MSRKIGALWSKKTGDGKTFLSGFLNDLSGDISIAIFKNDRKEKENQPDFNIVLSEKKERVERTENDFFGNAGQTSAEEEIKVEDIKF